MKKTTKKKVTFTRLTAAQKRVAIAKDARKQLLATRYKPRRGIYVGDDLPDFEYQNYIAKINDRRLFSKAADGGKTFKPCKVCQIGQALVSGIRLFNRLEISHQSDQSDFYAGVSRWFSRKQYIMMEIAFERRDVSAGRNELPAEDYQRALNFAKRLHIKRPLALSLAIWKNVIRNKGTFIP